MDPDETGGRRHKPILFVGPERTVKVACVISYPSPHPTVAEPYGHCAIGPGCIKFKYRLRSVIWQQYVKADFAVYKFGSAHRY